MDEDFEQNFYSKAAKTSIQMSATYNGIKLLK